MKKKEKLKLYLISINYIYKMKKIIFYIYKNCWDRIANPSKDLIEITVNRSFCEMNVSHLILLSHNLDDVESTI